MEQVEKRKYLIKTLLAEQPRYKDMEIPEETGKAVCPEDITEQAICIDEDIGTVIDELRK